MRILITGGAGFVGSHLAEAELVAAHDVVAYDSAPPDKLAHLLHNRRLQFVRGDILNEELLDPLVAEADLVYHLAAIANVQKYCETPQTVLDVNIGGVQKILALALHHGKKVFFSSSSEMYGKNPKVPWKETDDMVIADPTRIRWCYATTKAIGEFYCMAYARQGLRVSMARFFNFYGPRLDFLGGGRVLSRFLGQALSGEPLTVVEPGDQTRCFTFIDDGIAGIQRVAHDPAAEGEVFNLGTTHEISMYDLAQMVKRIGNFASPIKYVPASTVFGEGFDDIPRRVPDVTKAKTVLGWEPRVSLEEGLARTIKSFKDSIRK